MYDKVLVPLDGSNAAEIVLPYAGEIAAKLGAEIVLMSVSEPTADARDNLYVSYLERIVKQFRKELKDQGVKKEVKVKREVLFGKPESEIIRYAEESDVSLITMASRGLSGEGPWLLGHIAGKVLRATDKPVLLIRISVDSEALKERSLFKKILLPLDGSQVGEAAIPSAQSLAQSLGAELVLFQVIRLSALVASEGAAMSSDMIREEEEYRRATAVAYLNGVEKGFKSKGVKTSIALASGSPADQIIDYAEANAIDLIAMSTHGRSGIGRWVFGSVTDKVLHSGNTPVLTVRATKD
jgi:nucleotide-binding universal stress UspA family protein